jgi:hypothetical protein
MSYEEHLRLKEAEENIVHSHKDRIKKRPMLRKYRDKTKEPQIKYIESANRTHDFLKRFGSVQKWVCNKYGISYKELNVILALYSEDIFTSKHLNLFVKGLDYGSIGSVRKYTKKDLIQEVDISVYVKPPKNKNGVEKRIPKSYKLTFLSQTIVSQVYAKLLGKDSIPSYTSGRTKTIIDSPLLRAERRLINNLNAKREVELNSKGG